MQWLKDWVRELVTLVLLAGCLELLVPMGDMKKYVRMVMGLLVMVTVLNPVLALWKADLRLEEAFAGEETARLPSMSQIRAQAARYKSKLDDQVAGRFREQVEEQAAKVALDTEGIAAARAEAEVSAGNDGSVQVLRIRVYISRGQAGGGAVKPVDPVRVGQTSPPERPASVARDPLAEQVRARVASALALDPGLVTVMSKEAR